MLTCYESAAHLDQWRGCQHSLCSNLRPYICQDCRQAAHRLVAHKAAAARRALSGRIHENVARARAQPQRQPLHHGDQRRCISVLHKSIWGCTSTRALQGGHTCAVWKRPTVGCGCGARCASCCSIHRTPTSCARCALKTPSKPMQMAGSIQRTADRSMACQTQIQSWQVHPAINIVMLQYFRCGDAPGAPSA
jgi:hypothetical protein